jgi:hypothetical protein
VWYFLHFTGVTASGVPLARVDPAGSSKSKWTGKPIDDPIDSLRSVSSRYRSEFHMATYMSFTKALSE